MYGLSLVGFPGKGCGPISCQCEKNPREATKNIVLLTALSLGAGKCSYSGLGLSFMDIFKSCWLQRTDD